MKIASERQAVLSVCAKGWTCVRYCEGVDYGLTLLSWCRRQGQAVRGWCLLCWGIAELPLRVLLCCRVGVTEAVAGVAVLSHASRIRVRYKAAIDQCSVRDSRFKLGLFSELRVSIVETFWVVILCDFSYWISTYCRKQSFVVVLLF